MCLEIREGGREREREKGGIREGGGGGGRVGITCGCSARWPPSAGSRQGPSPPPPPPPLFTPTGARQWDPHIAARLCERPLAAPLCEKPLLVSAFPH